MTQLQLDARPEPCGLLSEPPRRPPTAIGAATLPPPNAWRLLKEAAVSSASIV